IVRRRSVTIGVCHLTGSRATNADDAHIITGISNEEVNVVEGVQELGAELEVDALSDPDPLDRAHIEPGETRPIENEVCGAALTEEALNAIFAIGRPDVASRWRAEVPVTRGAGGAHVEGADGVVNDVLRQVIGDLTRVIEAHLDKALQLVACHADEIDIAEYILAARLNARGTVKLPAADNPVEHGAGGASQQPAFANWQFVNPVELERVRDAEGRERLVTAQVAQRRRLIKAHRAADWHIGERPGEGVAACAKKSFRHRAANFPYCRFVVGAPAILHGESATKFARIDQEKIGRQPGGGGVVAEGRCAD